MHKFLEFGERNFKAATNLVFFIAIVIITGQIIESGFSGQEIEVFNFFYRPINLLFGLLSVILSLYLFLSSKNMVVKVARAVFLLISISYLIISIIWLTEFLEVSSFRLFLAVFIGFMSISFKIASLGNSTIHPAMLFVLSFLFLILFGTFCLMLPAASHVNVSFIQAFFTSTSAVTVTGLAVLDTGKDFTIFGQTIIVILIQLGGLGVLTITNIFALIFKTSTTYRNRMMVSDMIKELDNNRTFSTLFKIIFLTLLVEMVGAVLIYLSIYCTDNVTDNPLFFSIFHAISAFCNGGFSTLSNSLYEESVRYNYNLQLIISWLIITGGLGYTVMLSHYTHIKVKILNKLAKIKYLNLSHQKDLIRTTTNSKIVLITTFILLVSGMLLFMISEYDGILKEHDFYGKLVVSFFNSTTPRTAGFNNINMADLSMPAFMLTMALMWIGASPGSTGGGIKTTTFAVAILNLFNQIRGRERIVVANREIPVTAINQVNAVILLSIFAISFATFLLSWLNPNLIFKDLLFETISAYSTVGLSIGITASLNEASLYVLVVVMFLGRVSFLTFLIGLFSQLFKENKGPEPYYPKENVFIN